MKKLGQRPICGGPWLVPRHAESNRCYIDDWPGNGVKSAHGAPTDGFEPVLIHRADANGASFFLYSFDLELLGGTLRQLADHEIPSVLYLFALRGEKVGAHFADAYAHSAG